jgi:RimJ/RimL family protein N-acetyltransferase
MDSKLNITETSRLHIRQFSPIDVDELALILSDPEVMRHSIRGVFTKSQTAEFIDWCLEQHKQRGFAPCALIEKKAGVLIGFCGLSPEIINRNEEIHIGYRLATSFWGRGLATEAVQAVLCYGFDNLGLPTIAAIVEPEHHASIRVLEKTGFRSFECTIFKNREVRIYRQEKPGE